MFAEIYVEIWLEAAPPKYRVVGGPPSVRSSYSRTAGAATGLSLLL